MVNSWLINARLSVGCPFNYFSLCQTPISLKPEKSHEKVLSLGLSQHASQAFEEEQHVTRVSADGLGPSGRQWGWHWRGLSPCQGTLRSLSGACNESLALGWCPGSPIRQAAVRTAAAAVFHVLWLCSCALSLCQGLLYL